MGRNTREGGRATDTSSGDVITTDVSSGTVPGTRIGHPTALVSGVGGRPGVSCSGEPVRTGLPDRP